MLTVTVSC